MKVLNLYAGAGGNRKLWEDVEVTAVEIDPLIAEVYQDYFPEDKIVYKDAHQYLLDHYKEYDFIWSSPPCPTHSRARFWKMKGELLDLQYPDMRLYQEIIFLQYFCNSLYCVENVQSYYDPLVKPTQQIGKHYLWANFMIAAYRTESKQHFDSLEALESLKGFDLSKYHGFRKDQVLRSVVDPKIGNHILDCARGNTQVPLTAFSKSKRIET